MDYAHYDRTASRIADLAQRVLAGELLGRAQAHELAQVAGDARYDLFFWANKIRLRFTGPSVKFCSIVAGKVGNCSEDCSYCSQSKHHQTHVAPGKLSVEEMQQATEQALANGANSFGIVNSGRGPTDAELDWLEPYFRQTNETGRIRACATLGELNEQQAHRLKGMGVLRINHNLEASRRHFPNICTTHTYDDRLRTLRAAKAAGLSLCSGGIFGMGEVWDDRIDMALELRDIGADVVPINFLNAIHGTPLHGQVEMLTPLEALHIVALYRFLLPTAELKIAGGREKILRDMQSWMFFAGGNSFLIGNYLTTFGRSPEQDHQMLRDLGVSYQTFEEVEHEAPAATHPGPRPEGSLLSLPVV